MIGELGIQGYDGAKVHRVHVLCRASQYLLYDYPVCLLGRMERVPECVLISIRAQVGSYRAQSKTIIWSLPTACHLGCNKT